MKERDQFMRIAMARLRGEYKFYPQRLAVAGSMWRRFYDKKYNDKKD